MRYDATVQFDVLGAARSLRERIAGESAWARTAPAKIAALAGGAEPVLVEGSPGAGKAFVARSIHECGPRAHRPFVRLEAGDHDESVLVGILFDATGALAPATLDLRRELADRARGGTIFVADAARLSPELRARIVRAVAHPELEYARRRAPSARLVFAASAEVAAGVVSRGIVRIPELAERREDVVALAERFAADACRRLGKEPRVLTGGLRAALERATWPGGIAELKSTVERLVRKSGPPLLDATLLPGGGEPDLDALDASFSLHDEVERYERTLLNAALERCGGVQTKAAHLLGLKVSTLNSKLASHAIDASVFKPGRHA